MFKAAKAVLRRAGEDEEKPEPRRKSGDTEKGFGMAATALLRRVAEDTAEAYATARRYLSDTLDWLNLWEANTEADNLNEFDNDSDNSDTQFPTLNL